jgi:hypothetical protein
VTDMVIPPEAAQELARVLAMQQSGGMWVQYTAETKQLLIANFVPTASAALTAALPHLRPLFETATKVALELGRKEAAEGDWGRGCGTPATRERPYTDNTGTELVCERHGETE